MLGLTTPIKSRHIVIVEDIIDSGKTMEKLLEDLKKEEPASIKVAALFYKKDNVETDLHIDYIGFSINPDFIVDRKSVV